MREDDLCFVPATELAARIAARDISPVEVVRAVLDRIERHDGRVNAFAHLTPELALDMARDAERAVTWGDDLGPLHGVPVTIKDLHQLAGHPLEAGSHTQVGQGRGRRRPGRRAPYGSRRRHPGQDHHA